MAPNPPLILGSSSVYRRELLSRLGVAFTTAVPAVDECPQPGEAPAALAQRLARAKALAIPVAGPALIIGSDQVASLDGIALGKPGGRATARDQLQAAAGRTVEFHTAVAVADTRDGRCATELDVTRVRFRPLAPAEIERYLDREQPYDCAGSFKAEGLGITLFDWIDSRDPTALIGLPLIALSRLLRSFGIALP